jgi:hypothetical protein
MRFYDFNWRVSRLLFIQVFFHFTLQLTHYQHYHCLLLLPTVQDALFQLEYPSFEHDKMVSPALELSQPVAQLTASSR